MWPFSKIKQLENTIRELYVEAKKVREQLDKNTRQLEYTTPDAAKAYNHLLVERPSKDFPWLRQQSMMSMSEVDARLNELYDYLGVVRQSSPAKTQLVKRTTKK